MLAVVILSLGTDLALHAAGIFPALGHRMSESSLYSLPYRTVYAVPGGYITARLAPQPAHVHALLNGLIGVALSTLGAVVPGIERSAPLVSARTRGHCSANRVAGRQLRLMQLGSNQP